MHWPLVIFRRIFGLLLFIHGMKDILETTRAIKRQSTEKNGLRNKINSTIFFS